MATYRVEYTEIKPGGTECGQCDLVKGAHVDVVLRLAQVDIKRGSTVVTRFDTSDSDGYRVYGYKGE